MRLERLEDRRLLAITVDTLVDELDGSIVDGDISLRDALIAAPAGETIDFAVNGTLFLDAALGELVITRDLTLAGPGPNLLTIDAQGDSRVVSIEEETVVELQGLTLTGGQTEFDGAGIHGGGTLTVTNSIITGNRAGQDGGGIRNSDQLTVTNSIITGNSAARHGGGVRGRAVLTDSAISGNYAVKNGGGIYGAVLFVNSTLANNSSGTGRGGAVFGEARCEHSLISSNVALFGGGIYAQTRVTLDDCEVTGNSAVFRGGGIFDLGFGSSLVASSVSGNSARDGGGIHSYSGLLTLNRSTLIGNSAFGEGGAIKHSGGELRLHESTIAANYAQGNGGGIVNYGVISLWESTITGNSTPSNGGGIFNDAGWAYVRYSTISDNSAYALGGGIYNRANVAVISSTLSANTAGFSGGGLFNSANASFVDQGATLDNSTLSGNSAARGGAITNRLGGSMAVSHSTVTGNSAAIGGGILSVDGDAAQTSVDHSIVAGNEALTGSNIEGTLVDNTFNLIDIDPMLGPLADNGGLTRTHALYPGSPAIDAGDPQATAGFGDVPSWDQRGFLYARVFDGDDVPGARIDIGAYELPNSCDFDGNQSCDAADIDALIGVIIAGTDELQYDITGDGLVNLIDRNFWLIEAGARHLPSGNAFLVGDANLDGRVDGQDFIAWNQHKFTETGKWSQGDFNADGQTDGQDYVEWNRFKFQSSDDDESRDWLRSDW